MMNRRNLTTLSVLAGVALLALAVATASGSGGSKDSKRGKQVRVNRAAPPNAVDPATRASFAVLRRSSAAGDAVDMGRSSGMMAAEHGMALGLARRLPAGDNGSRAWVVPSADGVCILVRSPGSLAPGGGCGTGDELNSEGTVHVSGPGEGNRAVEVFGLAPDGVGQVELRYGDGSTESVPVTGNGYYSRGSRAPAKVAFTGRDGAVRLRLR